VKFVSYSPKTGSEIRAAVLSDGRLLDLADATQGRLPSDLLSILEGGDSALDLAREAVNVCPPGAARSWSDVRLRAPLPRPPALRDFFAFEEHAKAGAKRRSEELPESWYEVPAYYKGNHREIYGPDDEIPWPSYTRKLDFECEIACVVGKQGRDLSIEQAREHIFGYMIFNDWSARDIQKLEMMNRMGPDKGKDFANSFGPWLVTADEVDPRRDFSMKIKVNGELWSEGHFKDQYWGFDLMLSHVSQEETVYPGDVLGSGTFYRGCGLDLDRWLKPGDVIELEVPALGILKNRVGAPKADKRLSYRKQKSAA
jgi:2-keto-4-pentenoate hydratase/2-oxohepta-3-ene-1,7-dioic acid hydratase in catechol pathway